MIFTTFSGCRAGTMKKVKDLKVLDGKAAQSISILLGGSLKHMSYTDVRKCILRCDDSVITDNVLQQLITYFPPPDQLKKLEAFRSNYNDLTEAEQFAVTVCLSYIYILYSNISRGSLSC
jgi:diaphanous 2